MFATPKAKKDLFLASSLCDGVEDNNINQVTTLLDKNEADPNIVIPIYGITPFHLAVGNSSQKFAEEVTKLFLRHGGNPNIRSNEGLTPVHIAAAWGRCKVLELLLSNGGDPLLLDNEGYNPFHFAFDGAHYGAVNILRKYCADSTDEGEEELKYDIILEKLFINNKNVVAEYIVSDEQTDTLNLSPENAFELNIKTIDGSSTSGSQILFNDDFVTRRKNQKTIKKQQQENEKTLEEIDIDFEGKTSQEEKKLVSQIISRLSTSFSSDITKTDRAHDSDASLYGRRMRVMSRLTNASNPGIQLKQPSKLCNASPEKSSKGRLKSNSREERVPIKAVTTLRPERLRMKTPFFKADTTLNVRDHSVVSKSPNCNILSRVDKKKILEKSPTIDRRALKPLDNSIVSKSPNCAIISTLERKRRLSKTPSFEKQGSPKIVKKPLQKLISRTPCELKSNLYKSNSQKASQVSKSLPKSFHKLSQEIPQEREPFLLKKPSSVNRKNKSGAKIEDTEDSSGVYSESSKISHLKNVAMKLEDYMSEDFNSLSDKNDVQSTRMSESFEQEVLISLTDGEEKDLNTSLENGTSLLSETSSTSYFKVTKSTREASPLKYEFDNSISGLNNSTLTCELWSKSNLSDKLLLSMKQLKAEDNVRKMANSSRIGNVDSLKTDDLTEKSFLNRPIGDSFVSIEEEYKYKDPEEGVILMERRLCITPSCIMVNKEELTSFYTCSTAESVSSLPQEMVLIDKQTLRKRLTDLGENPGPITNSTHRVYLKRLMKLEDKKKVFKNAQPSFENPIRLETNSIRSSLLSLNWQKDLESYKAWENKIFLEFARPDPSRKWREGLTKASFNYLLLDSRITQDLPNRAVNLSLQEKWATFLSAIFYVGKGKRSRPYAHLYDAFHTWVSKEPVDVTNKKIKQILEIWNGKQGVVVLHVFHNTIPVEAYTREAAMIDALGVEKLGNCKSGEYYGTVSTWSIKEKCELGKYLLYKAMEILMVEGERHLFPEHL